MTGETIGQDAGVAGYYDPEKNATGDHYVITHTTPLYIRHDFIRKVLFIVALELLFTAGIVASVYNVKELREFFVKAVWIGPLCLGIFIVTSFSATFFSNTFNKPGVGPFIVAILTTCMSLFMAAFVARFKPFEITVAVGLTAAVILALAIFACQTKWDITKNYIYLFIASLVVLLTGLIGLLFKSKVQALIHSGIGAIVVCFYLIFDVQLLVGGRTHEWTVDDYLLASVAIYCDVVTLFMHLLRLAAGTRD